jgi:2-iminobutanoate/2-iminopropanoate deaminase
VNENVKPWPGPRPATSNLVFAAAIAIDRPTMTRLPEADSIASETRLVLGRVEEQLKQAGCSLRDVVKANCYLADDAHRTEFWAAWDELFPTDVRPVRLTLVCGLAGDCRVQLDVMAIRPDA